MIAQVLYLIAGVLITPVALCRLLVKSIKEPGYRKNIRERFGLIEKDTDDVIWVHAVSVGEARSVIPLIKSWRQLYPHQKFFITVTTPAGRAALEGAEITDAVIAFSPWDVRPFIRSVLVKRSIKAIWLVEKELWPEMLQQAKENAIPVFTVSMAVSAKSAQRYKRFASLFGDFDAIRYALCQDENAACNAQHFISADRCIVAGSLKYELKIPTDLAARAQTLNSKFALGGREILLFASTHEGEEALIAKAIPKLMQSSSKRVIAIMPRHPQRFDDVARIFAEFNPIRCSNDKALSSEHHILIIDVMGEALYWMQLSQLVVICGSLIEGIGGHNVLEPIAIERPAVVGPFNENNQVLINKLNEAHAIYQLSNAELAYELNAILEKEHKGLTARASTIYKKGQGAIKRHLTYLDQI